MDYIELINNYIDLEILTLQKLDRRAINEFIDELDATRKREGTIYIMGNGGSASTASHFVNDFNKGISEHIDTKFRCICLSDNVATIMAIANDISYEEIFSFQLRGRVTGNDLVIGISGSGNSSNVLKAIEVAKSAGAKTVGLTGFDGGRLQQMVDLSVHVPVMSMQITEDIHMVLDHLVMSVFYKVLCEKDHLKGGRT